MYSLRAVDEAVDAEVYGGIDGEIDGEFGVRAQVSSVARHCPQKLILADFKLQVFGSKLEDAASFLLTRFVALCFPS